ncbi:RhoGAP domain-containing protein [Tieghemostelium lacteum]|uniref:RhoGAP domain-containing protein n=1 Tax=Tieghemostelium lacteum TaxID=361077 RepID=A0A152A161_TIELA|nr:RhoGAP domain-containing protein [Tieghemostelium lacteum]|eukprot:KYQ99943.1 RhoGAP domain-containing protein [Tieghemostelium lacteum]
MSKSPNDENLYRKTSDNMSKGSNGLFGKLKNLTAVNTDSNNSNNNNNNSESVENNEQQIDEKDPEETFLNSKPKTIIDGAAKGIISLGSGFVNGATGIISKPIEGVRKDGFTGFFKGVAKGLSGVVILPVVGVMEFVSYSFQGIVNTPLTIIDAMKNQPKEMELKPIVIESKPVFFGCPLKDSLLAAKELKVPHIISICIEYILTKKHETGIFRINGSVALITEIQKRFESAEIHSIEDLSTEYTYEICGVFKAYFRYLPESLISQDKVSQLLNIQKSSNSIEDKIEPIRKIMHSIDDPNYTVLYKCTEFLFNISQNSKENLMTPSNLSIIFGISWLRPSETDIQEIANANTIVFIFISNFKKIFTKPPNYNIIE